MPLWAGQSVGLCHPTQACELMAELIAKADAFFRGCFLPEYAPSSQHRGIKPAQPVLITDTISSLTLRAQIV